MRLVFPPLPAAAIAVVVYLPLAHILPCDLNQMRLLLAGGLIGYLFYDMMHYYLHYGSPSAGGYLSDLKSYHVAHHYVNPGLGKCNFISTVCSLGLVSFFGLGNCSLGLGFLWSR